MSGGEFGCGSGFTLAHRNPVRPLAAQLRRYEWLVVLAERRVSGLKVRGGFGWGG